MPGIKTPLADIKAKVKAMVADGTTDPVFQTVRVWNNQIEHLKDADYPAFAMPACFVEVLADVQWEQLGEGFSTADIGVKFHLVHVYYDNQVGDFEEDLAIFDLRDKIIAEFTLYMPPGCGSLMKVNEVQDTDHDNVYYYIVEFVCSFVDNTGAKKYIETTPPTTPEIIAVYIDPKNYIIAP
jgi:hypothetical protein